jgi:hypothetical protein
MTSSPFSPPFAWAGEKNARPQRLGWWRTDILDETGAGDLLSRLTPRTQEWAALEAVREAARSVDERTRRRSATPDRILTLFHFGFELDEHADLAGRSEVATGTRAAYVRICRLLGATLVAWAWPSCK